MSNTILSGDLTIYYLSENRRKQITWSGGSTKADTQKMIDVYSAMQDLFSSAPQMDDGVIFSAETPGEYTIGKIDAADAEPWFIDLRTMQHIIGDYENFTGCALKTSGWKRIVDSNTGIVVVPVTNASNNIVLGDVGNAITHTDGDAGILLDVVVPGGTTDYLFVRPDSSAAANNFDSSSGTLTCNAHTATQSAVSVTGEMIWGNVYTQGGILSDTHIYLYQNGERVTSFDQTNQDWWEDGHLDRAIPITDYTTDDFPVIDSGYLTVYARCYTSGYSFVEIRMNTTSGGNVSAPLSSSTDSNNSTGYASITLSGGSGNWNIGDEISGDTSGARGIITLVSGTNPTPTLHFYYVGDPFIAFNGSEAITNEDDTGAATGSGSVANQGPALTTWFDGNVLPTVAFTAVTADIDDDGSDEPYSITWDLNQASLAQFYEYMKYVCRRGSTYNLDDLDGQEYIGVTYRVNYTGTVTGTVDEGDSVTGVTSGAIGVVLSHDTTNKVILLRNTRGTFIDGEQIQVDAGNYIPASGTTVSTITPISECPFGTLAGGIFFGSVGVLISDYKSSEENYFQLKDSNGVTRSRPTSTSMTVSNVAPYDWVGVYRLLSQGGNINKTEYSAAGGETPGDSTLDVSGSVTVDTPGKTAGGRLVLIDASENNAEYILRYSSWSGSQFILANFADTAEAGTNSTTIVAVGAFSSSEVGDLIYNVTRDEVSYISEVTSNDEVQLDPNYPIVGQTTGDSFEVNAVPITVTSSDYIFVPIILTFVTSGTTVSASMVFVSPIYGRTRVRNTSGASVKIEPFTSEVTIPATGGETVAVRNPDTVYNG